MGRIHQRRQHIIAREHSLAEYACFDQLDGYHPWQEQLPDGCVLYPVRKLNHGRVIYFNFQLAKEMGLIEKNHHHVMNKDLEKKLIDTFSIRIINEYDQKQNIKFHPSVMKSKPYMATRYLQLQHKNKLGKTSGDGRSIWNGVYEFGGTLWDVSSRGTGVTQLSPGAVVADKPIKSGCTSYGYGCGFADIDELVGAAIMAEIFYNNTIDTERVLTVIDLEDGNGIGVRAAKNLFRPAHIFTYLKQNKYDSLKKATDYCIERQHHNREWSFSSKHKNKYDLMLKEIIESFAKFSAQLDRDYIFAWLDWDGDNVLFNAGIIDYGSIRQFGLRHDEYRYDDVDRFSTNLSEQRLKTRALVQTFAQLVDFLNTSKKKPLRHFNNHWAVKRFNERFEHHLLNLFLAQAGISKTKRTEFLISHLAQVKKLYNSYLRLERVKTKRKTEKISDGINRPAIFNMRHVLSVLPKFFSKSHQNAEKIICMPTDKFFKLILAKSARGRDRKITKDIKRKILRFQKDYWALVVLAKNSSTPKASLKKISNLAALINSSPRLTGDGLLNIVEEVLGFIRQDKDLKSAQEAIDKFIIKQKPLLNNRSSDTQTPLFDNKNAQNLYQSLLTLVDGYKESI